MPLRLSHEIVVLRLNGDEGYKLQSRETERDYNHVSLKTNVNTMENSSENDPSWSTMSVKEVSGDVCTVILLSPR